MDFTKLAAGRYSVRRFADTPVSDADLTAVLEAGRLAPTACNNQPQRVYVLQSPEALAKARGLTEYTFGAPVVLVICADLSESWKNRFCGRDSGETDAAIVTTHMMLKAADLGLGTPWVGYFDPAAVKQALGLPDTVEPYAFLPLGHPAADCRPSPLHAQRKPLEETVIRL